MLKRVVHIVTNGIQRLRRIMAHLSDQIFDLMMLQRAGWRIGNALDLYTMSARFESRPGHRPSWLRFSWLSSILQGKCRNKAKTTSYQFIIRQSSCHSMLYCQRRRKRLYRRSNVMWRHLDIKPQPPPPRNSPSYGKQPQLQLPTLISASSFHGIFSQKMRGKNIR
jgi:hypothetical protein